MADTGVVRAARPQDSEAAFAVVAARDVADTGAEDSVIEDVETEIAAEQVDAFVFEDVGGGVTGYAVLDERGAMIYTDPAREGRGVGTALREHVERRLAQRGSAAAYIHVWSANEAAAAHLDAAGYTATYHYVKLRIEPDVLPELAPGVPGKRPYRLGEDDRAAHAVISEAFADIEGDTPTSFELFQVELLHKTTFAEDLSWVVEDAQGMVGAILCERREGVGYVADLGLLRRARGNGWGRALLAGALAGFRAAGLAGGELWVNGRNVPALGLYESVGMHPTPAGQTRWEKPLAR